MTNIAVIDPDQLTNLIREAVNPLFNEVRELITNAPSIKLPVNPPNDSMREDLITRKEAAKLLQVSLVTLSAWTKQGLFPFYRMNRRVYLKKSELLESLKNFKTLNLNDTYLVKK